jgi:hypothetical protein
LGGADTGGGIADVRVDFCGIADRIIGSARRKISADARAAAYGAFFRSGAVMGVRFMIEDEE